jgi:hypothetical protein
MTENRTRSIEEPRGYDFPPTDRIPVPGDLSKDETKDETTVGWSEDETVDEPMPTSETAPEATSETTSEATTSETTPDAMPEPEPVDRIEREEPVAEPTGTYETGSVEPTVTEGFFPEGTVTGFRDRWRELQAGFVDDPQRAVHSADELVDEIMRELAQRKNSIEEHWRDGANDTEELRVAIQEYRSFLNQLLNA